MSTPEPAPSPEPQERAGPTPTATTLDRLVEAQAPPLHLVRARERIHSINAVTRRHVVVLDDDPTGSQVVHDVPVLTRWDDSDLRWAFAHPARTFFILTNTRSLDADTTEGLLRELDSRIHRVAEEFGTNVALLSRSDSTLRGHFPLETDVLRQGATERGQPYDAVVLAPAYLDAGRVTVDDVHYAREGAEYVPVGQTAYAADEAFGYRSSSLTDWVEEKTGSEVPASRVLSVSLTDLRSGGVESVTRLLLSARHGSVVVVNALDESDLEVFVLALVAAEATGWRAICRVGPSFVPVRAGIGRRDPLQPFEIFRGAPRGGHGLVVVGSHVELTTQQVERLLELPGVAAVELDVSALLDSADERAELDRCADELVEAATGGDVVLMTSREQVVIEVGPSSLELGRRVSRALVELTRRFVAAVDLAWVVAKGGITSHDIATDGLNVRRATVLGQLFPGIVSVWRTEPPGHEAARDGLAGLPYVVFAGNVGDDTTLRDAVLTLRRTRHA